jgi:hypothetical protein
MSQRKLIYVAHPLGDGPDRALNVVRGSKWAAWAAEQGVLPVCTWIVLATQWPEDDEHRTAGLQIDCGLIDRCDEVWLCGPRVSKGMHVEATHAKKVGVPVFVLVDPSFTEGPPARTVTFAELVMTSAVQLKVKAKLEMMAKHHGFSPEEFAKLSAIQVVALEHERPFKLPTPMSHASDVAMESAKAAVGAAIATIDDVTAAKRRRLDDIAKKVAEGDPEDGLP